MPVIDGVKVACIPCIRGHRSTKCTHQAERIMIPVRKPGRPLSSCPHQKGKPCNCNNITAAIPRNGKCGCGTSEPTITNSKPVVKTEPPIADVPPMSPTRATSFRVQKHTSAKSPSRKHSYDVSLLSQMDPNAINMIPSHNLTRGTTGNTNQTSPVASSGFMPSFQSNLDTEGALNSHIDYAQMLGRFDGTTFNAFFENQHGAMSDPAPTNLSSNETGSHSSLGASGTTHYTPISRSTSTGSCANGLSANGITCCARGSTTILPPTHGQPEQQKQLQDVTNLLRYGSSVPTHGPNMSVFEFNGSLNERANLPHSLQNTAYTYPASYGSSFFEPLQYSQWQQMMTSHSQSIPQRNAYVESQSRIEIPPAMPSSYAAHQCGCGEGCQCLGCATHPFNTAMQEYVLSAMQDEQSISPSLSNGDNGGAGNAANEASPVVLPSPLADASPSSETTPAGMNDYLFVSYCPGSPQSCPCGDECACVGCMIHGQPAPRTPVTP
ncbi:hypothetical protein F4802DRAFT_412627 [Xylaria palmicola]|nr:hypothetical protein F4802DRAFT_412627 [Xylaria palmicola]